MENIGATPNPPPDLFWFRAEGWMPCVIIKKESPSFTQVHCLIDGLFYDVKAEDIFLMANQSVVDGTLENLEEITEDDSCLESEDIQASILHMLRERYWNDKTLTFVGEEKMISVGKEISISKIKEMVKEKSAVILADDNIRVKEIQTETDSDSNYSIEFLNGQIYVTAQPDLQSLGGKELDQKMNKILAQNPDFKQKHDQIIKQVASTVQILQNLKNIKSDKNKTKSKIQIISHFVKAFQISQEQASTFYNETCKSLKIEDLIHQLKILLMKWLQEIQQNKQIIKVVRAPDLGQNQKDELQGKLEKLLSKSKNSGLRKIAMQENNEIQVLCINPFQGEVFDSEKLLKKIREKNLPQMIQKVEISEMEDIDISDEDPLPTYRESFENESSPSEFSENSTKQFASTGTQTESQQNEIFQLKDHYDFMVKDLKYQIEELSVELPILQNLTALQQEQVKQLKTKNDELTQISKDKKDELDQQLSKLKSENYKLKQNLDQKQVEIDLLKSDNEFLSNQNQDDVIINEYKSQESQNYKKIKSVMENQINLYQKMVDYHKEQNDQLELQSLNSSQTSQVDEWDGEIATIGGRRQSEQQVNKFMEQMKEDEFDQISVSSQKSACVQLTYEQRKQMKQAQWQNPDEKSDSKLTVRSNISDDDMMNLSNAPSEKSYFSNSNLSRTQTFSKQKANIFAKSKIKQKSQKRLSLQEIKKQIQKNERILKDHDIKLSIVQDKIKEKENGPGILAPFEESQKLDKLDFQSENVGNGGVIEGVQLNLKYKSLII